MPPARPGWTARAVELVELLALSIGAALLSAAVLRWLAFSHAAIFWFRP